MFEGLDRGVRLTDPSLTWDVIGHETGAEMNVIIKGIEVAEDAAFAVGMAPTELSFPIMVVAP